MTTIAELNDALRTKMMGGSYVMTRGVSARGPRFRVQALTAVAAFDNFTDDVDPNGEHDFGTVQVGDAQLLFKIEYYGDDNMMIMSDEPEDTIKTHRVMTVMLSDEYCTRTNRLVRQVRQDPKNPP